MELQGANVGEEIHVDSDNMFPPPHGGALFGFCFNPLSLLGAGPWTTHTAVPKKLRLKKALKYGRGVLITAQHLRQGAYAASGFRETKQNKKKSVERHQILKRSAFLNVFNIFHRLEIT